MNSNNDCIKDIDLQSSLEEIIGRFRKVSELFLKNSDKLNPCTQIVSVESGAQYVNTQIVLDSELFAFRSVKRKKACSTEMPEVLCSEQAMALWKKAQEGGLVDENYQPLIPRAKAAVLADFMAERLKITDKWKVFEPFWNRHYMSQDLTKAYRQKQILEFQDYLKKLFG